MAPAGTHREVAQERFSPRAPAEGGRVNEEANTGPLDEAKRLKPKRAQG